MASKDQSTTQLRVSRDGSPVYTMHTIEFLRQKAREEGFDPNILQEHHLAGRLTALRCGIPIDEKEPHFNREVLKKLENAWHEDESFVEAELRARQYQFIATAEKADMIQALGELLFQELRRDALLHLRAPEQEEKVSTACESSSEINEHNANHRPQHAREDTTSSFASTRIPVSYALPVREDVNINRNESVLSSQFRSSKPTAPTVVATANHRLVRDPRNAPASGTREVRQHAHLPTRTSRLPLRISTPTGAGTLNSPRIFPVSQSSLGDARVRLNDKVPSLYPSARISDLHQSSSDSASTHHDRIGHVPTPQSLLNPSAAMEERFTIPRKPIAAVTSGLESHAQNLAVQARQHLGPSEVSPVSEQVREKFDAMLLLDQNIVQARADYTDTLADSSRARQEGLDLVEQLQQNMERQQKDARALHRIEQYLMRLERTRLTLMIEISGELYPAHSDSS